MRSNGRKPSGVKCARCRGQLSELALPLLDASTLEGDDGARTRWIHYKCFLRDIANVVAEVVAKRVEATIATDERMVATLAARLVRDLNKE
jgi:hypothetical protein